MKSGIYTITNTTTSQIYLGSSIDVHIRLQTHKNALIKDKHENSKLQRSYNKYGAEVFTYKQILTSPVEYNFKLEQKLLDTYVKWGFDFNLNRNAIGGAFIDNYMYSELEWKVIVLMVNKGYTSRRMVKLLKKGSTHRFAKIFNKSHYIKNPISKSLKDKFNDNNKIHKGANAPLKYSDVVLGKIKYLHSCGFTITEISDVLGIKISSIYGYTYSNHYKEVIPFRYNYHKELNHTIKRTSIDGKQVKLYFNKYFATKSVHNHKKHNHRKVETVRKGISECLKGRQKSAYGYKWEYL